MRQVVFAAISSSFCLHLRVFYYVRSLLYTFLHQAPVSYCDQYCRMNSFSCSLGNMSQFPSLFLFLFLFLFFFLCLSLSLSLSLPLYLSQCLGGRCLCVCLSLCGCLCLFLFLSSGTLLLSCPFSVSVFVSVFVSVSVSVSLSLERGAVQCISWQRELSDHACIFAFLRTLGMHEIIDRCTLRLRCLRARPKRLPGICLDL
jgi:hypothetical protein